MKKYLLAAAAVAALSTAAPASAQMGGILQQGIQGLFGGSGSGIGSRLDVLDREIRLSFQRRELSQTEAGRLQNDLLQLRQLHQSYKSDGLSRAERYELQQRLERLERRIQTARYDRDGGYDDDRYDGNDRYDYGDRSYGRNGCPPGLDKKNNGCLPPGQAKKQSRYDDQHGSYENTERYVYRRDGDRILQIDRRTGQVVRVIRR